MFMYYLTIGDEGLDEELVAVAGEESEAKYLLNNIDGAIPTQTRSLNQLLESKAKIPSSLKWVVESDRKFQARQMEQRQMLCEENQNRPEKGKSCCTLTKQG